MARKLSDFVFTALVSTIVTLTFGGVAHMAGYLSMPKDYTVTINTTSQKFDILMFKTALEVLREAPELSRAPATRAWAVDVFNRYASIKLPDAVKLELAERPFPNWVLKEMPPIPVKAQEPPDTSIKDGVIDMTAFEEQRKRQLLR